MASRPIKPSNRTRSSHQCLAAGGTRFIFNGQGCVICCRVQVIGIPLDWPHILEIAGFSVDKDMPGTLIRQVGGGSIRAQLVTEDSITFALQPSITTHNQADHDINAARAGNASEDPIETARVLAEKGNGTILQLSLVGYCLQEAGGAQLTLARYPEQPLLWEHLCLGFRQTLMRGVPQEDV